MKTINLILRGIVPLGFCAVFTLARAADQVPTAPAQEIKGTPVKKANPLIDPLTNTPYIAVHNGDLVDAIIFVTEFKRAHPTENAILVEPQYHALGDFCNAAAAFTWQGKVYLRNCHFGNVLIRDVGPADIEQNKVKLYKSSLAIYRRYLSDHAISVTGSKFDDLLKNDDLPHEIPNSLPGDNEDVQADRIVARLHSLGLSGAVAYHNDHFKSGWTGAVVAFEWNQLAYAWVRSGSRYNGLAGKIYLNSLVEGVLFAADYEKANPKEKATVFVHELSKKNVAGALVATVAYTKAGKVWLHHIRTGDLETKLSVEDLSNADKINGTDVRLFQQAVDAQHEQEAAYRHQMPTALGSYKAPDTSVEAIFAEMQKRGIDAKIAGDAGSPELVFIWKNNSYVYRAIAPYPCSEMYCFGAKTGKIAAN